MITVRYLGYSTHLVPDSMLGIQVRDASGLLLPTRRVHVLDRTVRRVFLL